MAPETMHGQAMALGDAAARAPRRWRGARWTAPGPFRNVACAASAAPPPAAAWPTALLADELAAARSRCPVGLDAARLGRARRRWSSSRRTPARRPRRSTGSSRPASAARPASRSDRAARSRRWPRRTACPSSPSRAATSRAARSGCCWRRCSCCSARPARRPTPADLIARGADAADAAAPRDDEARAIAQRLAGHVTVLYGSGMRAAVAVRLKNQINENAKVAAFAGAVPEIAHNEILGWLQTPRAPQRHAAVFLRDSAEPKGVATLSDAHRPIRDRDGAGVETWAAEGRTSARGPSGCWCSAISCRATWRTSRASTRWTSHGSPA